MPPADTESDATELVESFRGLARRPVVTSSAEVYRAYGLFLGTDQADLLLQQDHDVLRGAQPERPAVQGPRPRRTL